MSREEISLSADAFDQIGQHSISNVNAMLSHDASIKMSKPHALIIFFVVSCRSVCDLKVIIKILFVFPHREQFFLLFIILFRDGRRKTKRANLLAPCWVVHWAMLSLG